MEQFAEADDLLDPFFLLDHQVVALLVGKSDGIASRSETHVGIVLSEKDAVFGTAREHAVWLIDTLGHKVVDKDTDVRLVATQCERLLALYSQAGIDTGHQALSACFLITRRAVDLSCEIEIIDKLRFKSVQKLGWVEEVVFDGIARAESPGIGESRYLVESLHLNVDRKR